MEEEWDFENFPGVSEGPSAYGSPTPLKDRTRDFALRVIRLFAALSDRVEAQVIGKQLLRSATSVGANYREASRSRSDAEIVSKFEIGLQELEESRYWMELLSESGIVEAVRLQPLLSETDELLAIFVACIKKIKARKQQKGKTEGSPKRLKDEG